MSKYYILKEVKAIRDEINRLGERSFPQLEAEQDRAEEEYDNAEAEYDRAEEKYNITEAELDRIGAERDKVRAERNRLGAEYDKAEAEWDIKLFTLLTPLCPEARYRDWRGYLAVSKSKKEDWIIPMFTGDFNGIKHKAFPIWEMPKDSYDERDAKEVRDA
ncbi:MAG: hypothetical protein DDT19_00235 [Syntrophomonadaceae bacterium]|nr:hypothetical protein [Bacillota bacterium]